MYRGSLATLMNNLIRNQLSVKIDNIHRSPTNLSRHFDNSLFADHSLIV